MPHCRDCIHYERKFGCRLSGPLPKDIHWIQWPELLKRKAVMVCNLAVILKRLPEMSGEVLEVGHGVSKNFRRGLRKTRGWKARWWGIEPVFPSFPERRSFKASAAHMPMFRDASFDWVVALQCIEHWHEVRDSIADGLREIRRVLKPGGKLLVTAPFHVHGHEIFWQGRESQFTAMFSHGWSQVEFERWRWDHRPLAKLENWRIAYELRRDKYGLGVRYPEGSGQPEGPSSWHLEVLATK